MVNHVWLVLSIQLVWLAFVYKMPEHTIINNADAV